MDQSVPPDELIVVDDQSTDDSVALIRRLIARRLNARVLENAVNLGVDGAMGVGLKHARSEYVLFLASNDFLLPGIFARAKRCIARAPGVGLWSAMAWLVDESDRPIRLHPSPVVSVSDAVLSPQRCIELAHRLGNWFTGTSLIYRREALDEVGRFNAAFMGLSDLVTALMVASRHGAAFSPEPLCAIRMHADSHLERTLGDAARLERIMAGIATHGSRAAPSLFTPEFIERMSRRFRFASVRSSHGATLASIAAASSPGTGRALRLVDRLAPRMFPALRVALAFLILRPFDLLSTLWYRMLGWVLVRSRTRWLSST
jgi:cellulose synthase/poly-beta-1,6-N-acetylglucosamine synthase-like glycosyltransferase